jgi:hypothetical protein
MVNPTSLGAGGKTADVPGAAGTARSGAVAAAPHVQARQQLNTSIMEASMSVAISSGNEPLALLYKSALTGINEALAPDFGPDAIQKAAGQDNTPEGTAGRIVSLSTAFFDAFKAQNKGLDEEAVLQKFMDTIQGGVDQGFKEARGILEGLQVLQGDIAGNIDKTYALVKQGLQQFADSKRAPADNGAADAAA